MFFKKKKIEAPAEEKEESLIEHYRHKEVRTFKKPQINRDEIVKSIFQRDFSKLLPHSSNGKAIAMDSSVCNCDFKGSDIPNDILEFYGKHNFIGWQACAVLRQNPYIDKACTIPAQDAIAPDYKISYAENNDEQKEVDNEKLAEMKLVSDTDFKIKEICYHANVNKKTFGISLVVPVVDGVDYKEEYSVDKVKKGAYKGMVVVEPYWVAPQLDSGAVSNPMNIGFQEPTWWRMPNGILVHKSWCIKRCNSELPDILKPTYYYGGVPLTQKIYERVYAAEKVANEAPQLALTKRLLIADANIANLIAQPKECESILNLIQWCRDNFSVWFKNPDDQVQQIDTSLTDFDALVMTQYQLVASIADMPATKLLKTQPKGFNATGEYEQKDYIQSLQAIQDQDFLPILKKHYELFTKSYYGKLIDLSIVFNPVDTPTEKETAEVAKIWADVDASYIGAGVMSADEVRDIRRTEEGSPYSTLADDMEGGEDPELAQAADEALDERWITVHPNGEEEKGLHLLLEEGETPKDAMKRQWGVELKDKKKDDSQEKKEDKPKEKKEEDKSKNKENISDVISNDGDLVFLENAIKGLDHEEGAIFDKDGNVILRLKGKEHSIIVDQEDLRKMNNKVFTHNHPSGNTFSAADIFSGFGKAKVAELRAVTPDGIVYSIKPLENASTSKLLATFDTTQKKAIRTFKEGVDRKFKSGIITSEERSQILRNDANKYVDDKILQMFRSKSKEFGFEFKEYRLDD